MNLMVTMAVGLCGVLLASASAEEPAAKKPPGTGDFKSIRNEVETLRGKKFQRDVPVTEISEAELRALVDHELEKQFPGAKLYHYEELLAWVDMVPPGTRLKKVYADFLVDQVAGLYDSEGKKMCIPSFGGGSGTNRLKKANEKPLEKFSPAIDDIILAHEFTHALEDQFWPMEDPQDRDENASTDRGTGHSFVVEGSATRLMLEAVPAQSAPGSPHRYFIVWNLIHSGLGEFILKYALNDVWKSKDALVEGVPETLARMEAMPYAFGYVFCTEVMRDWGLDGLDYIYDHPAVSSEQVMHPKKSWEWRDFPVQVNVPERLPGGWKQLSHESAGEAGMAVLFGCQFKDLNRGLDLARGWDGDRIGLLERGNGKRLLIWAAAWDSTDAAERFVRALVNERRLAHKAVVKNGGGKRVEWQRPDGRTGIIQRDGRHVVILETDEDEGLKNADAIVSTVKFVEAPEEASRAAENSSVRRFNPLVAWQKDADYTVTRSFGGLLSRHDRNSVGSADSFLLGLLGESRRTSSFNKWELGAGLLARHESEKRRGMTKTTFLPWGFLANHASTTRPDAPEKRISRTSVLWGWAGSFTSQGTDRKTFHLLPFGLLYRDVTSPNYRSVHLIGTGWSRHESIKSSGTITRFRVLGIPVWTGRVTDAKKS